MRKPNGIKNLSPRERSEHQYKNSRANLLVVVIFTLVNIVMALTAQGSYFLFTAFIPYILVFTGMLMCGKLPTEWYEELGEMEFLPPAVLYVLLVIALIVVALYFLCWLFSKKHYAWMIVAFVLFLIDTLLLVINGIDVTMIVDLVFHVWVLYYLGSGMFHGIKLKNMPPEEEPVPVDENGMPLYQMPTDNAYGYYPEEAPEASAEDNASSEDSNGDSES